MRVAPSPTINWLLLVAAGIGPALLLGCSSAGRVLVARDPRTTSPADHRPERQSFDLMPAPSPGKPGGRRTPGDGLEASGPLHRSPDGKWIAFESDRDGVHGVWVADPNGARARRVSGNRFALRPRWSPDSTRLIFLARPCPRGTACRALVDDAPGAWNVWVADPEKAPARRLPPVGNVPLAGASWFPDSRHVCYGSGNRLVVVDTDTNAARAFRLPGESGRIAGVPAVSPDGRRIAFAVEGDGAWMLSLDAGDVRQIVTESDVDAFAWAPGGRQIAFRDARDGQWKVRMLE